MSLNRTLGGILFIVGTAVGSGMLALPIETAQLGFPLTTLFFLLCWSFMTLSALLLLESSLIAEPGSNLLRMAEQFLGKTGKQVALLTYLLLMYALCAAYLSGLTDWLLEGSFSLLALELSFPTAAILASFAIGLCLVFGVWLVDHLNRFFMLGLIVSFILLISLLCPSVQGPALLSAPLSIDLNKLSLIITSFGFHIVIPTLVRYIGPHKKALLRVICIGSLCSLSIYLLWEGVILGALPLYGEQGLLHLQQAGHPTASLTTALYALTHAEVTATAMRVLAFSVLITSFLGVSLSLFDCLQDTFHVRKNLPSRIAVALFTLLPPLGFALFLNNGFILALHLAGIFVSLLLGILPALMVFSARYRLKSSNWTTLWGSKTMLLCMLSFFSGVIAIEIAHLL